MSMIGYAFGPPYRITLPLILRGSAAIAFGRYRSLARDALTVLGQMPLPPLVRGADRIPEDGQFVVVANHYERPGLWMAWPAILISHVVQARTAQETHWIAIQEWETFSVWGIDIPRPLIRLRASVRHVWHHRDAGFQRARCGTGRCDARFRRRGSILGLMPEGTVGTTPELLNAREGAGLFLLLLAATGVRMLPVGIYEEGDRLVAGFGDPFTLRVPLGVSKDARDEWARNRVMIAIKELLPAPLWGAYAEKR